MSRFWKKLIVAGLVTSMAIGSLTACTPSDNKTLATIGDNTLTYGEGNFYVRYGQATYESYASYFGSTPDQMWSQFVEEGVTMEDNTKDTMKESLESLEILDQFKDDYNVELTDEELQKISDTADEFIAANDEEALKIMSGTKENVESILKMLTISEKMHDAMIADVDTDVSDEEAQRKTMTYAGIHFSIEELGETEDGEDTDSKDDSVEEVASEVAEVVGSVTEKEAKEVAEEIAEKGKKCDTVEEFEEVIKNAGHSATSVSFGKDTDDPSEKVCQEAFKLKNGEVSGAIKDEETSCYYVCMMENDNDEEATEAARDTIVTERQTEQYDKLYEEMKESISIKWNDSLWDKISMIRQGVVMKTEEPEAAEEETAEDKGTLSTDESLTSKDGDEVNIDFTGRMDGKEFEGGSDTDCDVILGSGAMIPGFEEQIIGHHPGETFDIDVTFPESYGNNQELAGKDATFTITLNGIYLKE